MGRLGGYGVIGVSYVGVGGSYGAIGESHGVIGVLWGDRGRGGSMGGSMGQ